MEALLSYLSSIHPLSDGLVAYLGETLKSKEFPRKAYLLKAGHISRNIYFISKGLLRCYYMRDGHDISSWFMKEGDVMISVESFFLQKESYESIQALEDTTVHYISYEELQTIYRRFPEFNFIGRVLTERYYIQSEQRLYSLRMMRSQGKYDYLMEHHPELVLRVPAKHLASYLGLTEVTLSKIKGRM